MTLIRSDVICCSIFYFTLSFNGAYGKRLSIIILPWHFREVLRNYNYIFIYLIELFCSKIIEKEQPFKILDNGWPRKPSPPLRSTIGNNKLETPFPFIVWLSHHFIKTLTILFILLMRPILLFDWLRRRHILLSADPSMLMKLVLILSKGFLGRSVRKCLRLWKPDLLLVLWQMIDLRVLLWS